MSLLPFGGAPDNKKVKTSSGDTQPGFLLDKLLAGANVTLSEVTSGGQKKVKIASSGGSGGGTSVVLTETETGDTIDPLDYDSGTLLVNYTYALLWVNVLQSYWLLLNSSGTGLNDITNEAGLSIETEAGLAITVA